MIKIEQEFMGNIAEDVGRIEVKPDQLDGLPPEYVASHPAKQGKVDITTNTADYDPFLMYAKDRRAALDLYVLHTNRGGEENLRQLDKLLRLRSEKAKLLGYPSWAGS